MTEKNTVIVTDQIMKDIHEFWEEYTKTHELGKNLILFVVDMQSTMGMTVKNAINLIIDEYMRQKKYMGKSAIEPAGGKG